MECELRVVFRIRYLTHDEARCISGPSRPGSLYKAECISAGNKERGKKTYLNGGGRVPCEVPAIATHGC